VLKSIKVEAEVLERLRGLSSGSISKVIEGLLDKTTPRADLDIVLDQQKMMFEILDDIKVKIGGGTIIQSEASPEMVNTSSETRQESILRIRAEQAEINKYQTKEINHPEDSDQSRNW